MASVFPDNRREQYLEKPLPSSEESERVILGAVLLDNSVIAQAVVEVRSDDNEDTLHERIKSAERTLLVDVVGRMARDGWTVTGRKASIP